MSEEPQLPADGPDTWRTPLERLVAALRELHRGLIAIASAEFEKERGPVGGRAALFHLLTTDPFFDWMHPLSELMVDIDALLDLRTPIPKEDAAAVRLELDHLLTGAGQHRFAEKYLALLQSHPMLAAEHGQVRLAMRALPEPQPEDQAELLHRRHRWAAAQKQKRRRPHENRENRPDRDRENQPIYFEDVQVGQSFNLGTYEVTREAIVAFARDFDPQPFHLDEEAARASIYGGLIASGWHTAAIFMRLAVEGLIRHTASLGALGVDEIRWLKPVRPGDVLSARLTIEEARPSSSKPDRGVVRSFAQVYNQNGELVMTLRGTNLFRRRDASGSPESAQ